MHEILKELDNIAKRDEINSAGNLLPNFINFIIQKAYFLVLL